MPTPEQIVAKLRKPPHVVNWVRYQRRRVDDTEDALFRFAKGMPTYRLDPIYPTLKDIATLGLSEGTALQAVSRLRDPRLQVSGAQLVRAFSGFCNTRRFEGLETFNGLQERFRISQDRAVPVKPTFVALVNGRPTPVFLVGWTSFPFDYYQQRLLGTIICETILTLEDFIGSDGQLIFFPRLKNSKERHVKVISARQLPLLSREELKAQVDLYGRALDTVIGKILSGE